VAHGDKDIEEIGLHLFWVVEYKLDKEQQTLVRLLFFW
jgi:hypothetical protein